MQLHCTNRPFSTPQRNCPVLRNKTAIEKATRNRKRGEGYFGSCGGDGGGTVFILADATDSHSQYNEAFVLGSG